MRTLILALALVALAIAGAAAQPSQQLDVGAGYATGLVGKRPLGRHVEARPEGTSTHQTRPDFSGRWTAESDAAPLSTNAPAGRPDQGRLALGDMGSGWGSPLTISQDASRLIVEQTLFSRYDAAQQPRFVYALDGSETRNAVMISHSTQVRVSRTAWDGQALRITTLYPGIDPGSGKPFSTEVIHRLSLKSPTTLVIEVSRGASLGGAATTTRTLYRKGG
jgi:hypothetical protein